MFLGALEAAENAPKHYRETPNMCYVKDTGEIKMRLERKSNVQLK